MNKIIFSAILVFASVWLAGAVLTTESGKKYEDAEIRKIAAGCVQIKHRDGETAIALEELPENFIAALSIRQRYALQSLVDLKMPGGKVYYKTTIKSLGSGFVFITHLHGDDRIAFKDLPRKYLATFTRRQLEAVNKAPEKKTPPAAAPAGVDKNSAPATAPADADKNFAAVPAVPVEKTPDGQVVFTGPRGGKYYINDAGKKVYLRKKSSTSGNNKNNN